MDVECAFTAAEARAAMEEQYFDAVVLDLGLPDADGLDLLRELRSEEVSTPCLVLTARVTVMDKITGLDAGADDYVVKPFDMDELAARLRALLRRPPEVIPDVLELGNLRFTSSSRQVEVDGRIAELTRNETALLEQLLRRAGRVAQRYALEDHLFGGTRNTMNALEVLVHRLRQKLGNAGATVSLHTVRGVGYLLSAREQAS